MRRMVAALLLPSLLSGCGGTLTQTAADCAPAIRRDGVTYVSSGFTRQAAKGAGQADHSECDDNGADARGAYFPEGPRRVQVWSFDGQDPRTALGVRQLNGTFRVFVAEGVDSSQILDALER